MRHWYCSLFVLLLTACSSALGQIIPPVSAVTWDYPFKEADIVESGQWTSQMPVTLGVNLAAKSVLDADAIKILIDSKETDQVINRHLQLLGVDARPGMATHVDSDLQYRFSFQVVLPEGGWKTIIVQAGSARTRALKLSFLPEIVDEMSEATIKGLVNFIDENSARSHEVAAMPSFEWVKGGSFFMGSDDLDPSVSPAHLVRVGNFFISTHEITVEEFSLFMQDDGGREFLHLSPDEVAGSQLLQNGVWKLASNADWSCDASGKKYQNLKGNHFPVVNIDWYEAQAYCQWLSKKTGRHFRLPTEAEWEYAAKGGVYHSDNFKYSGSNIINEVANFHSTGIDTVGSFQSNQLRLSDMSGNVWEWCQDWFGSEFYSKRIFDNPIASQEEGLTDQSLKIVRGGSWTAAEKDCLVASRKSAFPNVRCADVGFRIVEKITGL